MPDRLAEADVDQLVTFVVDELSPLEGHERVVVRETVRAILRRYTVVDQPQAAPIDTDPVGRPGHAQGDQHWPEATT